MRGADDLGSKEKVEGYITLDDEALSLFADVLLPGCLFHFLSFYYHLTVDGKS